MVPIPGKVGDVPGLSSWGVFLSYRREDAAPYARSLQIQLRERLPDAKVFMDLDSIEPGLDFAEVIREAVDSCAVLVALIGGQWATLADEKGRRRLDNPDDYVRFEVQSALERGVRVIPVLVDGAKPLQQQQLPSGLQELARLNALELSYGRYQYDADRLLDLIQRVLAAASTPSAMDAAQKGPKAARNDRARVIRLLIDAERSARSITDETLKVSALANIARALAATDRNRAAQLIADAERIARAITINEFAKADALVEVVGPLAAIDPDRAEGIAKSISTGHVDDDRTRQASALAKVAETLAATDRRRAAQLIADAERIAKPINVVGLKSGALVNIAKAVAATDRRRAARLIADAERIIQSDTDADTYSKAEALANVARALAATSPGRAERMAQSITIPGIGDGVLAKVAGALAATDLGRAERMAQSITWENAKAEALAEIAGTLAAIDPDRAEAIAQSINTGDGWTLSRCKPRAFAEIAGALAATDPGRAEGIAQSITNMHEKARALVMIAEA
jgi:hypothetical protein